MFKQRLSNVIAWFGFMLLSAITCWLMLMLLTVLVFLFLDMLLLDMLSWEELGTATVAGILAFGSSWIPTVVTNYLLIGDLRILPWKP